MAILVAVGGAYNQEQDIGRKENAMAETRRYLGDTGIALLQGEEVVGSLPFSKGADGLLLTNKRLFCVSKSRKEAKILMGLHKDVLAFELVRLKRNTVFLLLGIILALAAPVLAIFALSGRSGGAETAPAAPAAGVAQGILSSLSALVANIVHVGLIVGCVACALLALTLIVAYFVTAEAKIKCCIGGQEAEGPVSRKQLRSVSDFINRFYTLVDRPGYR